MGLDEGQLCGVVPIPVCKACQQEFGAFGPEVHLASVGERVVGLHGLTTLSLLTAFMTTPRGSTGLEPRRVGIWVQVSRGEFSHAGFPQDCVNLPMQMSAAEYFHCGGTIHDRRVR